MVKGRFRIEGATVDQVWSDLTMALRQNRFEMLDEKRGPTDVCIRAVWGSKLKAFLLGLLPFSTLMKSAQRCGCECRLVQSGDVTVAELEVCPYTELLDRKEIPLLTQGLTEAWTDHRLSNELWQSILDSLSLDWQRCGVGDRKPAKTNADIRACRLTKFGPECAACPSYVIKGGRDYCIEKRIWL